MDILKRIILNTPSFGCILIMVILISLFVSCDMEEKEILCSPKPPYLIEIINKDSVSIVGIDKTYHPDSIYFEINSEKNKAVLSNNYILLPSGYDALNDKDFYIYLNRADKDTLRLIIENGTSECGKYTEILEFNFNGKLIAENRRIYMIIK